MASTSLPVYRSVGTALLRTSTDPGGLDLPDDLDVFGDEGMQQTLGWLSALWQRADVRAALEVASPDLSRQLDDLLACGSGDSQTVRRAVMSMVSYVLRWRGRSTPFGLFAGVGVARIGPDAKVRWGGEHRVSIRADGGWMDEVISRLHQCAELRQRLYVVVNDAGRTRGGRFVVPGPAPDGAAEQLAPIEVSVRHSRPVRAVLEAAREPVRFSELRALLLKQFPSATTQKIDDLLTGLLQQGVLMSNLSAPMTCLDTLGHLCTQLKEAEAHSVREVEAIVRELDTIHRQLATATSAATVTGSTTKRMRTLSSGTTVTQVVDTSVDCDVEIPESVVREARDAVGVLFRLSPYPWGYPGWRDYHDRFRARYGISALVPVLELVADSGLGFPADYLGSAYERAPRKLSERDERLLALIQKATVDGSGELVLTDDVIEDLTAGDRAELAHLPPRVEVAVEIRSESVDALTRGRFALTVTGTPRPGSSMAGRHVHLLPDQERELIAEAFTASEPGAIAAQLSFAPRKRRNENVARTQKLLPQVIPIADYHETGENVIPVADLGITADERRFFVVQLSTGRHVEPRVAHALEAGVHTPPLARFLAEITTARATVYKAFHFGAAERLPYLPRIRYRRTILSPARWLLSTEDLPARRASMVEWEDTLNSWRTRWHVPDHVALVDSDRRQPLDLNHRLHRWLLRYRLDRAGRVQLRETAAPHELAWFGRAHELLIPLVQDNGPARMPSTQTLRVTAGDAGHLPGNSTLLCAQVYAHPHRFEEILTESLPALIAAFGDEAPHWWFRRHRQMRHPEVDQYLGFYLPLPDPSAYSSAAARVAAWADTLRRQRLLSHLALVTYEPQSGRYGHGRAMQSAHTVFAGDSAAAIAQANAAVRAGVPSQSLAAASMVDLAVRFAGSTDTGLDWLLREFPQERGRLDPTLRRQTLELADPDGQWTTVRSVPGGADVVACWEKRAAALTAYRNELAEQREPLTVLPSLLHGHHNRAVGVDPAIERITNRLARTCALRHTTRRKDA